MNKIIITNPPINCWAKGYPICKGESKFSLNKMSVYANQNNIRPNQLRLINSFFKFKKTLLSAGFDLEVFDFPKELDSEDCKNHDGVFIRDAGLSFEDFWIKANFSFKTRQKEAEVYARLIKHRFDKKIISLPSDAFIEFGDVYYFKTKSESFYFGGLSRSNKKGHEFVREIVQPDNYFLIESYGYHIDTVLSPVISKDNSLVALLVAKHMLNPTHFKKLSQLKTNLLILDNVDSSDRDGLGNYAVNSLASPGVLINGSKFTTPNIEDKLKDLDIKLYTTPLKDFNYSGGSVHCLTNEFHE